MTELDVMRRAKMYMEKLAQGIDPITDQKVSADSELNNARLARCFGYVADVLGQVIANGGYVGAKPKLNPFRITPEQLARIRISPEGIRVTQIVELIAEGIGDPLMKKMKTTLITDWLMEQGFLEKRENAEGKSVRMPTEKGAQLGIFVQQRQGLYGPYDAVYYNTNAQRFVLSHLWEILQREENRGQNR